MPKIKTARKTISHDETSTIRERTPMTDPNQPVDDRCFFFDLPAELRNEIYELVLVKPDKIEINGETVFQPGLLHTCQQIRAEASKIYYMQNTFSCGSRGHDAYYFHAFCQQEKNHWWLNSKGGKGLLMKITLRDRERSDSSRSCFSTCYYHNRDITCLDCPQSCPGEPYCDVTDRFMTADELQEENFQEVLPVMKILENVMRSHGSVHWHWVEEWP